MDSGRDFARSIIESPDYRAALIDRLKTRQAPKAIVEMLKKYARGVNEDGRAYARGILSEAGVSWERVNSLSPKGQQ
jgi:hypothetical protein